MRWLVEVSRVSDGSPSERYCIDARRWQSALQEVRRLRGDEGPLPKLTIELLDSGYRAIDPELKVRYVVTEAPADMPVTVGAQVRHSTQPPPDVTRVSSAPSANRSAVPAAKGTTASVPPVASVSAAPAVTTSNSIAAASVSEAPGGLVAAQVIRQRDESPTGDRPIHYRELALAVRPGTTKDGVEALLRARLEQARSSLNAGEAQQYVQIAVFDHMFVKRPVRPPIATLAWKNWRGDAVLAFPGFAQKLAETAPAASTRPPSWTSPGSEPPAEPAMAAPKVPSLAPAPVVVVGAASGVAASPMIAPAGASVPRPGGASPSVPPPAPAPAAARASVVPAPVVSVGVRTSSPPPAPEAVSPPRPASADVEAPVPLVAKRTDPRREDDEIEVNVELAPSSSPIDIEVSPPSSPIDIEVSPSSSPIDIEVSPPSSPIIDVAESTIPLSELPVSTIPAAPPVPAAATSKAAVAQAPAPVAPAHAPAPEPEAPMLLQKPSSSAASKPSSVPPSSGRRRRARGEDLIGDLFERMHELAFMADMVSGAEFVLHVLDDLIPCEGILIHVFDLGKREFVVVRARGPNARQALLHRTADGEPLVRGIMSRRTATILDGAPANPPPASSSLTKLGVNPRTVLCGAARLGGRYLGLIELANPAGDQPFHDGEANALDYVCEQFAEFVASRPIILDADVVVGP
jgi:hypothetical protein